MIVTCNWLREFVDFDFSPQDLAHRLTMAGLEVEGMTSIGEGLDTVVVARLEQVERHPDADRLTVCQVNNGDEFVQVVCGATNHKAGDYIALAQPGSTLPGDFKIKKSKIRGQESMGMLCSEKELGLSNESAGIMILDSNLALGTPIFEALGLKDTAFEIGLTPNRPDCLSVVGIAREVAAMCSRPLRLPVSEVKAFGDDITTSASVELADPQGCPRYAARFVRNVKIGASPDWMVKRLESVGMRSINNVVDITNYVMLELGHPMHAFDYRYLDGGKIVVKRADEGELFTTLDGTEHTLTAEDLMICDGSRSVAMAGVMGGLNSEVKDDTTCVLLEAAYFNPISIRRTSKRHGLHTESSHRFERGADIDMIPVALDRAASLIAVLAGGEIAAGLIDAYPAPLPKVTINLTADKSERLLGTRIELVKIMSLLEGIGLTVAPGTVVPDGSIDVSVPSFRPDLERDVDLIEEVARLFGYDNIPPTMPVASLGAQLSKIELKQESKLRNLMAGWGFSEIINYSFIAVDTAARLRLVEPDPRLGPVKIMNPLTEDQAVMRTTLVPSMLETLSRNLAYRSNDLHMYELRPVFFTAEGTRGSRQELHLTAAITGRNAPVGWASSIRPVDFYDLKGVLEKILMTLGVKDFTFSSERSEPYLHPGKSALVKSGKIVLGSIGELHPLVQKDFNLDQTVFIFDLNLDLLFNQTIKQVVFDFPSKFPAVDRDSALLLAADIEAEQVLNVARRHLGKYGQSVVIFDVYTGKGIPEGKKSLALRVRYGSAEKTLTEEDVTKAHGKLVNSICHQLAAEIR
ncbi:phenylalanine--tRNA ligase subunit beta [Geopsychrobacter electrodiphilus]|uniref:phenylalanine--tRNA ligase subunit beta n=1 Tax=Geopsychrobacter electrodiphilus TaxID=225196 RepID=UPI00036742FF|nr:phenylalanine--tRNA ligase subunit beta [Geopsychrobacter electrodiphilus]